MTTGARRTILLHGGAYTASRFLNQGVTFLLLPLYAHLLGANGVGVIEVLNVSKLFLAAVFSQGLEAAWFRFRFGATGEARVHVESTIVFYLALTATLGTALLSLVGDGVFRFLTPDVPFWPMGFLMVVAAATLVFPSLVERKFQGDQRPGAFAAFSLFRTLTTTLLVVAFVAGMKKGALGKVEAEALAGIALAFAALVVLRPKPAFSRPELNRSLGYGLPLLPHTFAGLANNLVDRFILSSLLGLSAVGVYSMGYRIAGIAMTVMVAVNQAFAPVFLSTLQRVGDVAKEDPGEADKLRAHIASVAFVNIVVGCLVAQGVAALAHELLLVATTPQFAESFRVVGPVCAGVVAWTWYSVMSQTVMFHTDTVKRLPVITIFAAATNVVLNYALVPAFGIDGAAWATFGSNVALAAGAHVLGQRRAPLPFAFGRWVRATTWTAVSLVGFGYLDRALNAPVERALIKIAWLTLSIAMTLVVSGIGPEKIKGALARE